MKRRTLLAAASAVGPLAWLGNAWGARKKSKPHAKSRKPAEANKDDDDPNWQPLFDGQSLEGWQPFFAPPAPGKPAPALPQNVFTVIEDDGHKLLRISGEAFGALVSAKTYGNYQLRVQWRWGNDKWPPRAHLRRSSGVILHAVPKGPLFGDGKPWPTGLELELQEGSCGDLWVGAGVRVDVPSRRERFMGNPLLMYTAGYPLQTLPAADAEPRVVKSNDYEKGFGEWNTSEALVFGGNIAFMTNGKLTMQCANARTFTGDVETPLNEGAIALASEGAEIHFKRIALRPLDKRPDRCRLPEKRPS